MHLPSTILLLLTTLTTLPPLTAADCAILTGSTPKFGNDHKSAHDDFIDRTRKLAAQILLPKDGTGNLGRPCEKITGSTLRVICHGVDSHNIARSGDQHDIHYDIKLHDSECSLQPGEARCFPF